MFRIAIAAAVALASFQPAAAATIFDYNVYASGSASLSGGSYGNVASGSLSNGGAGVTSHVASTAALDTSAQQISSQFLAMTPTGSFSYGGWSGDVRLTGTSSGVNVFNIGDAGNPAWSQLNTLTLTGPGTGAIINVWGSSLTNWVNLQFGGYDPDKVILNFHQASAVQMGGMNVGGTILAPTASVSLNGGSVAGSVVSQSFSAQGATVGGAGFSELPSHAPGVPEPGTWLMMILGFGAIGAVLRGKRKERDLRIRV